MGSKTFAGDENAILLVSLVERLPCQFPLVRPIAEKYLDPPIMRRVTDLGQRITVFVR